MNTPDLEHYHKIKHQLEELIKEKRNDEAAMDAARDADSQIRQMEHFMNTQFAAIVSHATMQAFCIKEMLESTTKDKQ